MAFKPTPPITRVVRFIKDWNPADHPRGYRGMFIDVPDDRKMDIGKIKPGGVFIFRPGDAYHLKYRKPDGTPVVHRIDLDSGQIESAGEPFAIDVPENLREVALVDTAPTGLDLEDLVPETPETLEERIAKLVARKNPKAINPKLAGAETDRWEEVKGELPRFNNSWDNVKILRAIAGAGYVEPSREEIVDMRVELVDDYTEWFDRLRKARDQVKEPIRPKTAAGLQAAFDLDYEGTPVAQAADVLFKVKYSGASPDEALPVYLKDVEPLPGAKLASDIKFEVIKNAQLQHDLNWLTQQGKPVPDIELEEAREAAARELFELAYGSLGIKDGPMPGPGDMGHLLSDDEFVVGGWLENYEIPSSWASRLGGLVHKHEKVVQESWADRWLRAANYDAGAEHTVDVVAAKDLYDSLAAELTKDPDQRDLERFNPAADEQLTGREAAVRQVIYDMAVAKDRNVEYVHEKGQYLLPRWDNIDFQPQRFEDVEKLLADTRHEAYDVPMFYESGMVKDGVVQAGIDKHYDLPYAHTFVPHAFDREVIRKMRMAGAEPAPNGTDLTKAFPYGGSGAIYQGDMLLIRESTGAGGFRRLKSLDDVESAINEEFERSYGPITEGPLQHALVGAKAAYLKRKADVNTLRDVRDNKDNDLNDEQRKELDDRISEMEQEAVTFWAGKLEEQWKWAELNEPDAEFKYPFEEGILKDIVTTRKVKLRTKRKEIEYVQHDQPGDRNPDGDGLTRGAATSQRGQLRMMGYSPQEATEKLQELGIVGNLESEVPFTSIMRGERRHGRVLPILSEYIRGDEPLPKRLRARVTHGITGGSADMNRIIDTGGVMPISERVRLKLRTKSWTSQKGDARSGIDDGVFSKLGVSNWGDGVKIVYKDDAYLRRDIHVAPQDFGGGPSRYSSYLDYKRKMREKAGLEDGTLWLKPWEPAARQAHIDNEQIYSWTNEWNLIGGVPVEDWRAIFIMNKAEADEVRAKLKAMEKRGLIAEAPEVVTNPARFRALVGFEDDTVAAEEPTLPTPPPAVNPKLVKKVEIKEVAAPKPAVNPKIDTTTKKGEVIAHGDFGFHIVQEFTPSEQEEISEGIKQVVKNLLPSASEVHKGAAPTDSDLPPIYFKLPKGIEPDAFTQFILEFNQTTPGKKTVWKVTNLDDGIFSENPNPEKLIEDAFLP